jgi:RNA methyltransferase, TrmH family
MLSKAQEKHIRALKSKKDRLATGLCLVEGQKVIDAAGDYVDMTFTREDTLNYEHIVDARTPQGISGIARVPKWSLEELKRLTTIIVLDGVQDPGNVGSIFRLALGFNASVVLIESADPTSPKVIRSSVGALFQIPWLIVKRADAEETLRDFQRPVYRLESKEEEDGLTLTDETMNKMEENIIIIAGSEGNGIKLSTEGQSIAIGHGEALESLNVAHALAIMMHARYQKLD